MSTLTPSASNPLHPSGLKRELLTDKKSIRAWLKEKGFKNFTVQADLKVSIVGIELLQQEDIPYFPFDFFEINSSFTISGCGLQTLEGLPSHIKGSLNCSHNKLTTLVGAPQIIKGTFICDGNLLTDLIGSPDSVGQSFSCQQNELTSLIGISKKIGGHILLDYNETLTTLKGLNTELEEDKFLTYLNCPIQELPNREYSKTKEITAAQLRSIIEKYLLDANTNIQLSEATLNKTPHKI